MARTVYVECRRIIGKRKVEVSPKISAGEGGWGEKRWQGRYMLSAGEWEKEGRCLRVECRRIGRKRKVDV